MINIIADTHTHTLACDHAYSTLAENVAEAKAKGLLAIAMTEHSPSMPGGPSRLHTWNLSLIPREIDGVRIIKGVEVNIMDNDGALDLDNKQLIRLEWVIASMHTTNLVPSTVENHTRAWLSVAQNPLVDVIGHCGDGRYHFDHEPVLNAVKQNGKIVEINAHSFRARPGSTENCTKIARRCAELQIPVVVSSDAHHASGVGVFADALNMLMEINFPQELILNADKTRFFDAIEARIAVKREM